MHEVERKSNILGLLVLFVVLTVIGVVISYFYIILQANVHDIWVNIIAAFVVGLIFACIVWFAKRLMKITNNAMSVVVVVLSLAIVMWCMWNMWFVLKDRLLYHLIEINALGDMGRFIGWTREMLSEPSEFWGNLTYYNSRGTWRIEEQPWTGVRLWAVWAGELLILIIPPIVVAYTAVGLYLIELNSWVKEKLMNYGFTAFDDYELDRLAAGDINVILEKPLEAQGGPMNAVAVCYYKNEPADFIAIHKAYWDKDGVLTKGRHIMTVKLDQEKLDTLDAGLQAKHFPGAEEEDEIIITTTVVDNELPPVPPPIKEESENGETSKPEEDKDNDPEEKPPLEEITEKAVEKEAKKAEEVPPPKESAPESGE